jgi:hypothetical protein
MIFALGKYCTSSAAEQREKDACLLLLENLSRNFSITVWHHGSRRSTLSGDSAMPAILESPMMSRGKFFDGDQ